MKLILASASPRRREILAGMGAVGFEIRPSDHESPLRRDLPVRSAVTEIALGKGRDIAKDCGPDDIVIAADTLVFLDGEPLGKPADADDAKRMLRALSGREHEVVTGMAVIRGDLTLRHAEVTDVRFRALSEAEIDWYVATGEPLDKAGAYGVQGLGRLLVQGIYGDYYNVVGLPAAPLALMLREAGLDLMARTE